MSKRVPFTLLSCFLLTACASPEPRLLTVTKTIVPDPPAELLTCKQAPSVPADPITGQEVGRFIIELDAAGADCRTTLRELADWIARAKARFTSKESPP